ncbi:MAG TPA: biotin carboxylase N-terminal domain-containing protein, partial [Fibrobacteria bacterium]|nr:biotin carboxylase N-terminal domain-containing protein [Fibrobacteria bacterium]
MGVKTFQDVLKEIQGKRILVANRGITARRVLRSVRERFQAVPVLTATKVDMTSPSVAGARELILLGEDPRAYLDLDLIIREAKAKRIAAIHPGWGFASEDHEFPKKCAEAGIVFIGPTSEAMNLLGNKVAVRNVAKALGIPVVPGSENAVTVPEAREIASSITFPIML